MFMIAKFTNNNLPGKEYFMNFNMQAMNLQHFCGMCSGNQKPEVSFYHYLVG
jgi:hypothetical protein